jgi:hypothetical protein
MSSKLFVGIGLMSYSLYLWHYPIFALMKISDFAQDDILKKILPEIIILILSMVSYYFIEKPARDKKFRFVLILKYIGIIISLIILFSLIVIGKQGKLNKLNVKLENSITSYLFESECKYSSNNINFLRDVFFKVDKHHTGRIPIEPLLNWLFKGKHTPETNVKKSNAREGGRAAAALYRKESPLYNGRSTSDIRKFYSPTGVEIKGHHAMPQKTKSKQLGPSKKIVSRLYFDAGKKKRLLEEREKEKIKRQMEGCTFQPNVGPPPPAWTTEPTRMYDAGGDDMLDDTMNKEKGPAAAARRATMNLLYGV